MITPPITQELVEKRYKVKKEYDALEEAILKRMDYILRKSMALLGLKVDWWSTQSEEAKYDTSYGSDNIWDGNTWYPADWEVTSLSKGEEVGEDNTCFIDKFGKEWCLFVDQYPERWLFEDFEQELSDGRAAYLRKQLKEIEEKKLKAEKKKISKQLLKEQAKAKLSKEEQEALGLC